MTATRPRANVWVSIPEDCRIESAIIAEDDIRMVIGHPAEDGHTLEAKTETLRRLHAVIGDTLDSMDNGSWANTSAVWVSDPAAARN